MKKHAFIVILTIMIAPLWAQTESDFRVAPTSDGGVVIRRYSGTVLDVVIPDTIQYMPVKEIGAEAFRSSNITGIVIPEGVTTIGSFAFLGCSELTTVVLPKTINRIDEGAFNSCTSLTTFTVPSSIRSIIFGEQDDPKSERQAFSGCSNISSTSQRDIRRVGYKGDF